MRPDQVHYDVHLCHGPQHACTMSYSYRNQVLCAQDQETPRILSNSYCVGTGSVPVPTSTECSTPGTGNMVLAHTPLTSLLCAFPSVTLSASTVAEKQRPQNTLLPKVQWPLDCPRTGAHRYCRYYHILQRSNTSSLWLITCANNSVFVILGVTRQLSAILADGAWICFSCCHILL